MSWKRPSWSSRGRRRQTSLVIWRSQASFSIRAHPSTVRVELPLRSLFRIGCEIRHAGVLDEIQRRGDIERQIAGPKQTHLAARLPGSFDRLDDQESSIGSKEKVDESNEDSGAECSDLTKVGGHPHGVGIIQENFDPKWEDERVDDDADNQIHEHPRGGDPLIGFDIDVLQELESDDERHNHIEEHEDGNEGNDDLGVKKVPEQQTPKAKVWRGPNRRRNPNADQEEEDET